MIDIYRVIGAAQRLLCRVFGHEFGPYYGMPQAHCWRCGERTRFAQRERQS